MPVDCENFLKKLIDKFCLMYDSFIGKGFLLIKEDYLKRTDFLNKTVTIRVFDKYISGVCSGITDTGGLKLIENNREHVFLMGDIL